jgi:hypothetical protein
LECIFSTFKSAAVHSRRSGLFFLAVRIVCSLSSQAALLTTVRHDHNLQMGN